MRRLISLAAVLSLLLGIGLGVYLVQPPPVPPEAAFAQALRDLEDGDFSKVRETADKLRVYPSFEQHGQLLQAASQVRQGRGRVALDMLKSIAPEGELAPLVYLFSGEALYLERDLVSSMYCMERLLELQPDNSMAHRWLAAIHYDLGTFTLAEVHLDRLIKLEPDDYRPYRLKGSVHADFEQFQEAADDYRQALEREIPPDQHDVIRKEFAHVLLKLSRFREVLDLLDGVESNAEIWRARAAAWRGLAEPEKFVAALEQARTLDPEHPELLKLSARNHLDRRELSTAKAQFGRLVELVPYDVESMYQLALVEKQLGNEDAYRTWMERKDDAQLLHEEMTELSRRILVDPLDAASRTRLAEICDELGRDGMADVWRRAATESAALAERQAIVPP